MLAKASWLAKASVLQNKDISTLCYLMGHGPCLTRQSERKRYLHTLFMHLSKEKHSLCFALGFYLKPKAKRPKPLVLSLCAKGYHLLQQKNKAKYTQLAKASDMGVNDLSHN